MRTLLRVTTAAMAFSALGFSVEPVATVSSSQPFTLAGHAVTIAGITSWPVVIGDDLTAGSSAAILYFRDGSSVKVTPGSGVKVSGSITDPRLTVTGGTLEPRLATGSKITVANTSNGKPRPINGFSPDHALTNRMPPVSAFQ